MLGFGQILAPLYGSTVTDFLGFRWTCDIVAMISFTFSITYFFVGGRMRVFYKTRRLEKEDSTIKLDNGNGAINNDDEFF